MKPDPATGQPPDDRPGPPATATVSQLPFDGTAPRDSSCLDRTEYQAAEAIAEALRRSAEHAAVREATEAGAAELSRSAKSPDDCEAPPAVPAGHRAVQKLGEGTYGKVWLFEEERTGIRVAVKFFPRGTGQQWELLQADVRQLAVLHGDPGIVQLLDVDAQASPPYYVMTYAAGGSLASRLERGVLPADEALRIFREVCRALAYVHAKGIRHCDLKPGNVLLDACGRPLVADFGQAHLCSDDTPALGTFFYMAPEQADLDHSLADTRWDVYGLGAVFYAMVTGRPPRESPEIRAELSNTAQLGHRLRRYREWVGRAQRPEAHRRVPGVDWELAMIIDRCLELDPARRYRDAGAVLDALGRRDRLRARRPLLWASLAATLAGLLLVGTVAFLLNRGVRLKSEQAVVGRVRRNDETMAHLIAGVLTEEIEQRLRTVRVRANDRQNGQIFGRLLARGAAAKDALVEQLKVMRVRRDGQPLFDRLTAADARGHVVAADPPLTRALAGENRSWREWYNGEADHYDQQQRLFAPLSDVCVSGPFIPKESETDRHPLVSFSCRVADPDHPGEAAGVLVGFLKVAALSDWLPTTELSENHGAIVVVNRHGHLLMDSRRPEAVKVPAGGPPDALAGPLYEKLRAERSPHSAEEHRDPLDDGKRWVAAGCPVNAPAAVWSVVVQHERDAALQPIQDLANWLRLVGIVVLVAVGAFAVAAWGWLLRFLRHEVEKAHA